MVRGKTDVELLDSRTKRSAIIIKEVCLGLLVWFALNMHAGLDSHERVYFL